MNKSKKTVAAANGSADFEQELHNLQTRALAPHSDSPATTVSDVIETLYSEHRFFLSLLDRLQHETDKLKPGKIPDYHLLLDIIDYLTHYPDQFHHPREDLLFAKLLSVNKKFLPDLKRLEREHKTLHVYNDKLFAELKRIASGRRVDRPELMRNLNRYVAGYRQHIAFESKTIFPKAKGELSATDMRELQAKTRYIDDPLFGVEVEQQYRRVERSVQSGFNSFRADLISREITGIESAIRKLSGIISRARQLQGGISQINKMATERNISTVKQHLGQDREISVLQLPNALLKNHKLYLKDSFEQVKAAVSDNKMAP
ncbi:MAG: hemerythrin domain-containing protein [Halioglobus sp.]